MPDYVVRVELLGEPAESDYGALHEHMLAKGFEQKITEGETATDLPRLMYAGTSLMKPDVLAKNVHNSVRLTTWSKLHVFVIERKDWYMFWTD